MFYLGISLYSTYVVDELLGVHFLALHFARFSLEFIKYNII